jgi:hypothetical protein
MEFLNLEFQGQRKTKSAAYELGHLFVAIDTTTRLTEIRAKKPLSTRAVDRETKETNGSKNTLAATIGGTLSGILGGKLTGTWAKETSWSDEVKKFKSRITKFSSRGLVWWGFSIDDPNQRERGILLEEEFLPSVEFEFLGDGDPPPPPEFLRVEVKSCWSLKSNAEGWVPKWLDSRAGQSTSLKVPSHSVLCQVVVLEIPTYDLSESSKYMATLDVKATDQVDVQLLGSIKVIPSVLRRASLDPGHAGKCFSSGRKRTMR